MPLSLDTAYRSFGGEVEASSTPTICRLPDSRRHQLWAIALISKPITQMTTSMERLATGDLTIDGLNDERTDEIGAMAQAPQVCPNNHIVTSRLLTVIAPAQ